MVTGIEGKGQWRGGISKWWVLNKDFIISQSSFTLPYGQAACLIKIYFYIFV